MTGDDIYQILLVWAGVSFLGGLVLLCVAGVVSVFVLRHVAMRIVGFRPDYDSAIKAAMFATLFITVGAAITNKIISVIFPGLIDFAGGAVVIAVIVVQSLSLGSYCYRWPLQPPPGHRISFRQGLALYLAATAAAYVALIVIKAIVVAAA